MRKKTIAMGVVATCLLLTSSVMTFASEWEKFPYSNGFDFDRGILRAEIEARRENIKGKLTELKESSVDMSIYEQYGLNYDENKGGWCYRDKLVGLLVDKNGRGITILNKDGEIHLKAIRDESGNITGLVELTSDEYSIISSAMEDMKEDMKAWKDEMFDRMKRRMSEYREMFGSFLSWEHNPDPATLREANIEIRQKMEQQREQFKTEWDHRRIERKQRIDQLFHMLEQQ